MVKHLTSLGLLVLLIGIAADRLLARRSFQLLSVDDKARVGDVLSVANLWAPLSLAAFVIIVTWLPLPIIPRRFTLGLLTLYGIVPFLISFGARATTLIRLSRAGLPAAYLRIARWRVIFFHLALLILIAAVVGGLSARPAA